MLKSRFFTSDDKRMDTLVFPLPTAWWSRPYEYAWAAEFVKETDVVLDAACGICHPFKFWLAEHCKAVHAVDKDERINDYQKMADEIGIIFGEGAKQEFLEKEMYANIDKVQQANIRELPYKNNIFDKIFLVSVIEHLSDEDKLKNLKEFRRTLKNSGQIILTVDYPDTTMDKIEAMANGAGLKLAGEKDTTIPGNAICLKNHNLYCFRMVLIKG